MNDIDTTAPIERLRRMDMNLLVAFDALMQTRSVSNAATQLGVSQSAMSHTLRRLRDLLDDPLLVRVGASMQATERAEALEVPLRASLVELGRVLGGDERFDPSTSTRRFNMAAPDLFESVFMPALWQHTHALAPGVGFSSRLWDGETAGKLETGELDLAIGVSFEGSGELFPLDRAAFKRRRVTTGRFVCFMREGHPLARRIRRSEAGLRAYMEADHLLVAPTGTGRGISDAVLEARGLRRRVALMVATFGAALPLVANTDLVLTAPDELSKLRPELVVRRTPIPMPTHSVHAVWHRRHDADEGARWLRERVKEVVGG